MLSNDYFTRRLQLFDKGYQVTPNLDKRCFITGWSSDYFLAHELPYHLRVDSWKDRWPHYKATGGRITDGLATVDEDIDDGPMIAAMWQFIEGIASEIAARAPTRYGGGQHKLAFFCTTDATPETCPRMVMRSHKYHKPGEEDHHCVEIFLSHAGSNECHRQFGLYGPHSYNPDGSVKHEYVWAEGVPALWEVAPHDLPLLTVDVARAIIDEFDRLAVSFGWERINPDKNADDSAIVRDIDQYTRFDMEDGTTLSYAELVAGYDSANEARCTSSFCGDPGSNPTKCQVGRIEKLGGKIGVFNFETGTWHAPVAVDNEAFAKQLKAIAADAGIDMPIREPNWRERNRGGSPKPSLHNAGLAIEAIGVRCSWDTFHDRRLLGRSSAAPATAKAFPFLGRVTDPAINSLRKWLSNSFGLDFTEKHIRDAVNILCEENKFDPVCDMLDEAQANWDGKLRLDRMAHEYFNAADTELNRQCVRKTMIAAVARARTPGIKFDTILTMESKEGLNKSTAWRVLAGDDNFSDQSILGQAGREVQEQLAGIWIHENAELAGLRKTEVELVKAFASRTVDRARPAYGHYLVEQPRHSIEVGTTNNDEYLQSTTGNRRFWPIKVERMIDVAKLRKNRLQLWGEAAHYQSQGEELTLDEKLWSAAGIEQESRRVTHPWEAILANITVIAMHGPLAGAGYIGNGIVHKVGVEERVATSVIFEHVLRIPNGQLHGGHSKTLADVMRSLGWSRAIFLLEGKTVKGYKRTTNEWKLP